MTDLDSIKYTAEHEWVDFDPAAGVATVGITDYAADQLGDVVYVDLPAAGAALTAGEECGEIESTKSVSELYAPLTGEVTEINDAVVDDPSVVNADAFGAAWLLKMRAEASDVDALLDRAAYLALTGGDA